MKVMKVSPVKKTVYLSNDAIDTSHFHSYDINSVEFDANLHNMISWCSDLKFMANMFNNYLWMH